MRPARLLLLLCKNKQKKTEYQFKPTLSTNVIPMKRDPPGGGVNVLPSYSPIHLQVSRKFDILLG